MSRINKKTRMSLSLLLTIILILGSFTSFANAKNEPINPEFSSVKVDLKEEALSKIMPEVMEDLESQDIVEVLVYMREQVDTKMVAEATRGAVSSTMTPYNTKLAVRRGVVEALKDNAELTQVNILNYLKQEEEKGNVLEYESFFIVNMVYVKANKDIVENISYMPEVEKIYKNKVHTLEFPEKGEEIAPDMEGLEWNIERIRANEVWDGLGIDGAGAVVGSLDSGVDWNHPALKEKWRGYNPATGETNAEGNWFDPVYNAPLPEDSDGHGTHTMGTMVGQEPDGSNKIGVAPGAKWITVRVFDNEGYTTDKILLDAAQWMLAPGGNSDNAPDVVNNSWSGGSVADDWYMGAVDAWRNAEIVPVFSAGNQRLGEPAPWPGSIANPANYPQSFAVGATDKNNLRASFSKLGPSPFDESIIKPEITAPGVGVRSSIPNGGYASYNGTSMSAPAVSGTIALIASANSSLSVAEIEEAIMENAMPLTDSTYPEAPNFGYGHGLVDAFEAVSSIASGTGHVEGRVLQDGEDLEAPVIVHEQEVFETFAGTNIDIIAQVTDDVAVTNVELLVKEGGKSYWIIIPMNRIAGDHKDGTYKGTITYDLLGGDNLLYKIRAKDYAGEIVYTEEYRIDIEFGIVPDEYSTGFETEPVGWIFDGSWDWGAPSGNSPTPYEGDNVAGTNLSGNYPNNADDWLITPPIDLRDKTLSSATLWFHEWYEFENNYDFGYLLVTNDYGYTWTEIRSRITGVGKEWKESVVNLGDYIGSQDPVFVAFRLTSDTSGVRPGWFVDNVRLVAADNEAPATPENLVAEAGLTGIKLNWSPVGDIDLDHYNVYRSTTENGKYGIVGTASSNNFVDTEVELGNTYYYKITAVDFAKNESDFSNITSASPLQTTIVFGTDFEENDGGFVSGLMPNARNELNPWEWGIPTFGPGKAYSGEKLWATNLSGDYDNYTDAYIESPTITLPNDKDSILTFNHWVSMEGTTTLWDYGQVLVSKDDGANWTNITPNERYGREVKAWTTEELPLTSFKGEDIKIRFYFHSDVSGTREGWYIDDVYIIAIDEEIADNTVDTKIEDLDLEPEFKKPDFIDPVEPYFNLNRTENYEYEKVEDIDLEARVSGIPVDNAVVTILETGRSIRTEPGTGRFGTRLPVGEYTLRAEAYGFHPNEERVVVEEDGITIQDIVLVEKGKGSIVGRVFDRYFMNPASNAVIRVVEDPNIKPVVADENGEFTIEGIYEGKYTLKVVADGFEPGEFSVNVISGEVTDAPLGLKRFVGYEDEISYDNDMPVNALVLNAANAGLAVRFTPAEYGMVTGTRIYFWGTDWPSPGGNEIGIAIFDIDNNGKPFVVGTPKVVNIERGKWNTIDLSEYGFGTDRDFYIATMQTNIGTSSPGVGIDETSSAPERSYLYVDVEDLIPIADEGVEGGLMIRAIVQNIADTPEITNLDEVNYTNEESIVVEGKTTTDGKVNLYVNDEIIETQAKDGMFSVEIDLEEEITLVKASSVLDGVETEPTKPITIIKDTDAPELEIIKPLDGEAINVEVAHIVGNVYDKYLDKVLINGEEIEIDENGDFHERLIVDEGENIITITAIDLAGNTTEETRKVVVKSGEPIIGNIQPSRDIVLKTGDVLKVSFNAEVGGEGRFRILPGAMLSSNEGTWISMEVHPQIPNLYEGTWTIPEGFVIDDGAIVVEFTDVAGNIVIRVAEGRLIVEPLDEPEIPEEPEDPEEPEVPEVPEVPEDLLEDQPMENLPSNTVIIGNEAFDIRYLNNNEEAQLKLIEWYSQGNEIYIKLSDSLIVNIRGDEVEIEELPEELTYYARDGKTIKYVGI